MITKLTAEQRAMMPCWAEKWIKNGLSTEEVDFEKFEASVKLCYKYAGLNTNIPFIRVQSPIVGALASSLAANYSAAGNAVYSAVCSAVDSTIYSAVKSVVDRAVDSAVGSEVNSVVGRAVDSEVNRAVSD